MNAHDLKKAKDLSKQFASLGYGKAKIVKPKKIPSPFKFSYDAVRTRNGTDGKDATPPSEATLRAIIEPLLTQRDVQPELPTVTADFVKEIIKIMHSLPENDKLEVSKGIRNAQSFIYGGTKYQTSELMHGAGSSTAGNFTVISVSGTINDSNVTFTTTTQPTLLNINGGFYQTTGGAITWTYSGGTITLSSAVGTGGSIYGI